MNGECDSEFADIIKRYVRGEEIGIHDISLKLGDELFFLIKKLFFQFKANKIVLDANGLGVGLLDFLTIKTENEKTGEVLPIFGVDKESDKKEWNLKNRMLMLLSYINPGLYGFLKLKYHC